MGSLAIIWLATAGGCAELLCALLLVPRTAMLFLKLSMQAVRDDWYFQMYYDDLPVWGFIGKVGGAA
jgi:hypothetical protein